jgi:hypothetical protein
MVPLLLVGNPATGLMTCLASDTRVLAHEFVDEQSEYVAGINDCDAVALSRTACDEAAQPGALVC